MLKNIYIILWYFTLLISKTNAEAPPINCIWLPWCKWDNISNPEVWDDIWTQFIWALTWYTIQFVAVIAVLALIISGIMYLISWWDEEKVKKAKNWIIWSLVAVFLSISAWSIINILNNLQI